MRISIVRASVAMLLALGGIMSPAAVGRAIAAAPAPTWIVDAKASRLGFQSSEGGVAFSGAFTRWQAAIRFDPKNLAGSSVRVDVDMASARTGAAERDEALPTSDWFATAKFARATFAASTFKEMGAGRYQAVGTLTIRGVTRPLVLPFMLKIAGNQARMEGSTVIDRHVFGVGQGQYATADSVPFQVKVVVSVSAKRT